MSKETTPIQEELRKEADLLFQNNSDCYADTWRIEQISPSGIAMREGSAVPAMTKEKFVELWAARTSAEQPALYEGEPVAYITSLPNRDYDTREAVLVDRIKRLPPDTFFGYEMQPLYAHPKVEQPAPVKVDAGMQSRQQLRQALKKAKIGLEWWRENYPEGSSGADDEMFAEIDEALAADHPKVEQTAQKEEQHLESEKVQALKVALARAVNMLINDHGVSKYSNQVASFDNLINS